MELLHPENLESFLPGAAPAMRLSAPPSAS